MKFHTHGVKKPYEAKAKNIEGLYNDQKRYYPVHKGQIDEWGAVIKRQAENYQRDIDDAKNRKHYLAQKYSEDLAR